MVRKAQESKGDRGLVLTIGHSTRTIDDFISLLQAHGVTRLVDVRTVPRSRTNPQFNKDLLSGSLSEVKISYVHVPELCGLRKPKKNSPNRGWRNLSFRGYADHMQSEEFKAGLAKVLEWMREERLALMCAEAVPWRCHRSLINRQAIGRTFGDDRRGRIGRIRDKQTFHKGCGEGHWGVCGNSSDLG